VLPTLQSKKMRQLQHSANLSYIMYIIVKAHSPNTQKLTIAYNNIMQNRRTSRHTANAWICYMPSRFAQSRAKPTGSIVYQFYFCCLTTFGQQHRLRQQGWKSCCLNTITKSSRPNTYRSSRSNQPSAAALVTVKY
jgi:hypothetical protein